MHFERIIRKESKIDENRPCQGRNESSTPENARVYFFLIDFLDI